MKLKVEELPLPFQGSFEASDLTIITGIPNSGKTLLLRYLHAINVTEDKVAFPILYALCKYQAKHRDFSYCKSVIRNMFYSSLMSVLPYDTIRDAYLRSEIEDVLDDASKVLGDEEDVIFISAGRYTMAYVIDEILQKSQITRKEFQKAVEELDSYDLPFDVERTLSSVWMKSRRQRTLYKMGLPHFVHLARFQYAQEAIVLENRALESFERYSKLMGILALGEFVVDSKQKKVIFKSGDIQTDQLGMFSGAAMASFHIASILAASVFDKKLVLIDEPELLYHPLAQYAMGIALFLIASKGIKVIIVTHSPLLLSAIELALKDFEASLEPLEKALNVSLDHFRKFRPDKVNVKRYFMAYEGKFKINEKEGFSLEKVEELVRWINITSFTLS